MNPKTEPVRVRAIVSAVIQLLVVLGVTIPTDVSAAVITLAVALVPLLTWLQAEWSRRRVSPISKTEEPSRTPR